MARPGGASTLNDPQHRIHVSHGGETVLPTPLAALMAGRDFTCQWSHHGGVVTVTFTQTAPATAAAPDGSTPRTVEPDPHVGTVMTTAADILGPAAAGARDRVPLEAAPRFVDAWRALPAEEQRAVADTIHGVNQPVPHPSLGITGTPHAGVFSVTVRAVRMKFAREAGHHPVWLTLTRE